MVADVFVVTRNQLPHLFEAFELISHDSGNQAGHENYAVPLRLANRLWEFDLQLWRLKKQYAEDGFSEFLIGAESYREDLVKQQPELKDLDQFLQEFFAEEWWL